MSGAAGMVSTALCKDIVLLLCARTTHTHTKRTQTLRCMGKYTCVHIGTLTHTQTVLWSKWSLRILEGTPSQRETLFYSSSHPPHSSLVPHLLTSILHVGTLPCCHPSPGSPRWDQTWIWIPSWGHAEAQSAQKWHMHATGYSTPEACFNWFHHIRPPHRLMCVGPGCLACVASRCLYVLMCTTSRSL